MSSTAQAKSKTLLANTAAKKFEPAVFFIVYSGAVSGAGLDRERNAGGVASEIEPFNDGNATATTSNG